MPKKRIYKQKQKQKQSQKVIVNINTKGSSKKRSYNKKPIITQPQIIPNNYNIPSLIVERPTQNYPPQPPIQPSVLLKSVEKQKEKTNALLNSIETQTEPTNALLSSIKTQTEPTNALLSSIKIQTEPTNAFLNIETQTEPTNALLNIETQTEPTNALLSSIKIQTEEPIFNTEEYKENELLKELEREEKFDEQKQESIIKAYKIPTAEEIENQVISIEEAKTLATNPTEARRMIQEQHNTKLEKEYEEYKNLGGKIPLKELKKIKQIRKKINEINEINAFLADQPKTKKLKEFLENKNVMKNEYINLSKPDLIKKVQELII